MIRMTVLPVLLVGLLACDSHEEFDTQISGKVVNRFTQEPIEGAWVTLEDGIGSSGGFSIDNQTSSGKNSETYTDADGEFSIKLTGEYQPALGVSKEGYEFDPDWTDGVGVGVKLYGYGGNYENQLLEMEAYAGFNLFVSTVPVNSIDSLVIITSTISPEMLASEVKNMTHVGWNRLYVGGNRVSMSESVLHLPVQQEIRFVPGATAEEFSKLTTGDTYTSYQIAYTRNGQWETKIDSVYIKSLEVYTDTIYY